MTAALVLVLLAFWFGTSHTIELPDGQERFQALDALVLEGRLTDSRYSIIGPLFAVPLYLVGLLWKSPEFWCARYNFLLLALLVAALHRIFRARLAPQTLNGFLLALAAVSMFPNHQTNFFGDMFTVVSVAIGIAAVSTGRAGLGWTLIVLGGANTPASVVGVAAVAAAEAVSHRRVRFLLAPFAVLALLAVEAWLRRGSPFTTGYQGYNAFQTILPTSGRPGFSYPFLLGLLGVLFSFGKGLVWFAPGLLVPVASDDPAVRTFQKLSLLFVAGLVPIYAKWWAWYGGWAWGPRFFLFASVPASLALASAAAHPAVGAWRRAGLFAALVLSTWVGANGAVYGLRGLEFAAADGWRWEFLVWHVPEFTVLWHPLVVPVPVSVLEIAVIAVVAVSGGLLASPVVVALLKDAAALPGMVRERFRP